MDDRRDAEEPSGRSDFGTELLRALRAKGLTQTKLAAALDGTQSAVSAWVSGDAVPRVDVVFRIEALLDLPPGHLSHRLGYLPAAVASHPISSLDAIREDPLLTDIQRQAMIALYHEFTIRQSPRPTDRP